MHALINTHTRRWVSTAHMWKSEDGFQESVPSFNPESQELNSEFLNTFTHWTIFPAPLICLREGFFYIAQASLKDGPWPCIYNTPLSASQVLYYSNIPPYHSKRFSFLIISNVFLSMVSLFGGCGKIGTMWWRKLVISEHPGSQRKLKKSLGPLSLQGFSHNSPHHALSPEYFHISGSQ